MNSKTTNRSSRCVATRRVRTSSEGERIERAAAMTYWDYEEAVLRFQKILEVLGVSDALKAEGVTIGDTVFIGDVELEWAE